MELAQYIDEYNVGSHKTLAGTLTFRGKDAANIIFHDLEDLWSSYKTAQAEPKVVEAPVTSFSDQTSQFRTKKNIPYALYNGRLRSRSRSRLFAELPSMNKTCPSPPLTSEFHSLASVNFL